MAEFITLPRFGRLISARYLLKKAVLQLLKRYFPARGRDFYERIVKNDNFHIVVQIFNFGKNHRLTVFGGYFFNTRQNAGDSV